MSVTLEKFVKLLGIHIDHKLSFDERLSSLSKKAQYHRQKQHESSLIPYADYLILGIYRSYETLFHVFLRAVMIFFKCGST